ncbi:MAG TPA: hypothetical protein PKC79_03320 [Solidesulfovibrio magneticus]|nr:hypothetical protein [Solidesulfovibrio magneticus]
MKKPNRIKTQRVTRNNTDNNRGQSNSCGSNSPKQHKKYNIFEWTSLLGIPDAVKTLVFGVLCAITLSPYLGGSTIWFAGSNPITIPKVSGDWFWAMVFLTPLLWTVVLVRLIGESILKIAAIIACVLIFSYGIVLFHKMFPQIALSSINKNFDQTYRIGFLESQTTWDVGHSVDGSNDKYCYFVTDAITLKEHIPNNCAFRVLHIEVEAGGDASINQMAGFDFAVYIGTNKLRERAVRCVPKQNWPEARIEQKSEVEGGAVIHVDKNDLRIFDRVDYKFEIDYSTNTMKTKPTAFNKTKLKAADIYIKNNEYPKVQVVGWTLWGDPCFFRLEHINIRVQGCLLCNLL